MTARRGALIAVIAAWLAAPSAADWTIGVATASPDRPRESPDAAKAANTAKAPGPVAKKHQMWAAKRAAARAALSETRTQQDRQRWQRQLDRRLGAPPEHPISLYNTWTHEYLVVAPAARATTPSKDVVNAFLRCHFTNEPADMDPRLFRVLVDAARHFGARRVDIVSGFRAPKYNLILRKKGHEVARNSQHTLGHAVDFRIPGVSAERLRAWAKHLRLGGVGYYPKSGFVHVDVGRVRYWTGR